MKRSLIPLPILVKAGMLKKLPKKVSKNEIINQDATRTTIITIALTSIVNINAIFDPCVF
jgi:hypothetical protein